MDTTKSTFELEGSLSIKENGYRFRIRIYSNEISFITSKRDYDKYFMSHGIFRERIDSIYNEKALELRRVIKRVIYKFYKKLIKLQEMSHFITLHYNDEECFSSVIIKLKLI